MATKTISVDLEAYDALVTARRTPDESFSRVIKRAKWDDTRKTAGALLAKLQNAPALPERVLDYLEQRQKEDKPPQSKWKRT